MDDNHKWFHVTSHTYGVWLYGDPRGFRTRHHREHIEGDYKNPPRGEVAKEYAKKYERSKKSLKKRQCGSSQKCAQSLARLCANDSSRWVRK